MDPILVPDPQHTGKKKQHTGKKKQHTGKKKHPPPGKTNLQETLDIIGRGQVEGCLTLLVLEGGVGSVGQQQGAQLGSTLLGRLVQRGETPLI